MVGKTLSHYKILEKIGQGGMGEVYLAQDTKLDRKVALKFLPEELQQDSTAKKRFLREAKSAAALDHPYICHIHEVGEAEGKSFISMEYIQGTTLREKLAEGPLPVKEALEKATEIAEALEAAHKQEIVHRDLKPSNIMLTPEGHVKVMDFGLAKRVTPVEGQEEEITTKLTQQGSTLGTVPYMSPEQVRGQEVDTRSDIFSFGVVVYEMLSGVNPFKKGSAMDTATAILSETVPPLTRYTENIPVLLQHTVKKMLAKELDRRYQLIHEVRTDLEDVRNEIERALKEPASPTDVASAVQPVQQRWVLTVGLVVLALAVGGMVTWLLIQSSSPEKRLNRFTIIPSLDVNMRNTQANELAISPDGRHFAYRALGEKGTQLYLRSLDDFVDRPIPGTEGALQGSFFSPDGESVAFFAGGSLKKVSLMGGASLTLCDAPAPMTTGSWGFEDTIVFSSGAEVGSGLYRVSSVGGEPELLATPNLDQGENRYTHPHILPDGENVLFSIRSSTGDPWQIAVLSLETKEQKTLLANGRQAHYLPTGHLVYELSGTGNLMAVPFNLGRLEVTGEPVPLIEEVRQTGGYAVDYSVSQEGTLVYVPGQTAIERSMVWVDREGRETLVTEEKREYAAPKISPDGKQVALSMHKGGVSNSVWIYDVEQDSFSRLTLEGTIAGGVAWTSDGKWLTFQSNPDGQRNIYRQLADRSGLPERLTTSPFTQMPTSWSPDGKLLAFHTSTQESNFDIKILNMEEDSEPQGFISSPDLDCCAQFSPDGAWLAYVSNEEGRDHVYVRPYPGPEVKFRVTEEDGGGEPIWSPDGTELFYRTGNKMLAVSIQTEPRFTSGRPIVLFEGSYRGGTSLPPGYAYYDISPDGQRFLMSKEDRTPTQINVVLNWFEELKRLVPTN